MSVQPKHRYSFEAYLELERSSEEKHEFLDGEVFAMGGASFSHTLIAGNIFASLHQQLRGRPCRVVSSDLRVKVGPSGLYTYPDIVVVCGEPRLEQPGDTLINPSVLIEVLSDSTEKKDRGWKFEQYQHLVSLTDYLLVAQDTPRIEHFARAGGNRWLYLCEARLEAVVEIASVACSLSLQETYAKVQSMREPMALYRAANMAA